MENEIVNNIVKVQDKINIILQGLTNKYLESEEIPKKVNLVIVSKTQSSSKIQLIIDYFNENKEIPIFGENYLQEFVGKKEGLKGQYEFHFIGALQGNKVKKVVQNFDVIQSASSLKLCNQINSESLKINKIQKIFLQINISNDESKQGFSELEIIDYFNNYLKTHENIEILGIMAITANYESTERLTTELNAHDKLRVDFKKMYDLKLRLITLIKSNDFKNIFNNDLILSMGMSADYDIAIECGSTMVRIGSAIFGERI